MAFGGNPTRVEFSAVLPLVSMIMSVHVYFFTIFASTVSSSSTCISSFTCTNTSCNVYNFLDFYVSLLPHLGLKPVSPFTGSLLPGF